MWLVHNWQTLCLPSVAHPIHSLSVFTLCPWKLSSMDCITWAHCSLGFHQWKALTRDGHAEGELGVSLCSVLHSLIFWQRLLPSETTAPVSSPSSTTQGLTGFRKLHFLPLAFQASMVITSYCCSPLATSTSNFGSLNCAHSSWIVSSWKVLESLEFSSVSC